MPLGRHKLQAASELIIRRRAWTGLEPVGGEFQPSFETPHPGGGPYLFTVLHSIFVLKLK